MTDAIATDEPTNLERLEQARALGERIAALTPALAGILEQLEPLVAAQSRIDVEVEALATVDPDEMWKDFLDRLGHWMDVTGSNANRRLLRAISDLANTESETYAEAGR
jgi:hypothetical protein